jgi:hypothetical protein
MTHTNLVLLHHLKYLSIDTSLFLLIRSEQMNDSKLIPNTVARLLEFFFFKIVLCTFHIKRGEESTQPRSQRLLSKQDRPSYQFCRAPLISRSDRVLQRNLYRGGDIPEDNLVSKQPKQSSHKRHHGVEGSPPLPANPPTRSQPPFQEYGLLWQRKGMNRSNGKTCTKVPW